MTGRGRDRSAVEAVFGPEGKAHPAGDTLIGPGSRVQITRLEQPIRGDKPSEE